ncbi:30S ribosomal protein S8 [Candidatus Pacearchaeota archaeon]|nr:30S ribosomal protein S8 [uncultured archaeon]MBS3089425.1 30S ribosomal protein S8 [Candidatus Pacearchaeota archaeon]
MAQDILADALNKMMNAKKAGKDTVLISHTSKILSSVLAIAKLKGYVKEYSLDNNTLKVSINKLNGCKAIKPRFLIRVKDIDQYIKRYLPAKDIGIIILSTSEGLMTHHTAQDKNIGGSLIAYFY